MEGAGVIDSVGSGVVEVTVGTRVAYSMTVGSYAEYAIVPASAVVEIPGTISTKLAAAIFLQGLTAHYLTTSTCALSAGSTVLIHAAAGGVGRLLVQVAKIQGAIVIATVSTEQKREMVRRLGADDVAGYDDFPDKVEKITGGKGVDVVYDSVGHTTFDRSISTIARRGHMVSYGQSSGSVDNFKPGVLSQNGSLYLTRPVLSDYIADRKELTWRSQELFRWVESGQLDILVHQEYPLEDARDAHTALASRATAGKLIVTI
jgi:NADPH2:quinone reductase